MGSLAKEFQTTTRRTAAPGDPGFNPEAYGSLQAEALSKLGNQIGKGISDTAEVFGNLERREQESSAALAGAQYELELKGVLLDLEQTKDHNEWQREFENRSSALREKMGRDFNGPAGEVFSNRATLANARQEIAMRTGIQKRRVERRRADTLLQIDTLVELGSDRPERDRAAYMDEIKDNLDRAEEDLLLPADEVARLRIVARDDMETRYESKRISNDADAVVSVMLDQYDMKGTPEHDPDNEITDASILANLDRVKDPEVERLARRRYKERKADLEAADAAQQKDLYETTFDAIRNGAGQDSIPAGLDASYEKSLISAVDYYKSHNIGNSSIETDTKVYGEIMSLFTAENQDAFAKFPLHTVRLKLSTEDFGWFEARQNALGDGTGAQDRMAYRGDVKWLASQAVSSLSDEDRFNMPSKRAKVQLQFESALETAREQKRATTKNPNAELTRDEGRAVTDEVILNESISVPVNYWIDPTKDFEDLSESDVNAILDDQNHELRMTVTTKLNQDRARQGLAPLDSDDPRVENEMIDYLDRMGAPRV